MPQVQYRGAVATAHHATDLEGVHVFDPAHHSLLSSDHKRSSGERRTIGRITAAWRRLSRAVFGVRRVVKKHRLHSFCWCVLFVLVFCVVTLLTRPLGFGASSQRNLSGSLPPRPSRVPPGTRDAQGWYRVSGGSSAHLAARVADASLDLRTAQPQPAPDDRVSIADGEYGVEEPYLLPGVVTHYRVYTPDELLVAYANMTILYSFVNGTDTTHAYRKAMLNACAPAITASELKHFARSALAQLAARSHGVNKSAGLPLSPTTDGDAASSPKPWEPPHYVKCFPPFFKPLQSHGAAPVGSLRAIMESIAHHTAPNSRDRETDELRHSFRSVEAHMQWHRGRVVIVSPGHHPQWVDRAKNFLASRCATSTPRTSAGGRNSHPHVRVMTVHQDAIMPYGVRLTLNSHTIEKYLWRVRNLTSVHLYFNDDYFVNRDAAITDFLNEHGGTIVRTERSAQWRGFVERPPKTGSWSASTSFTHHFNTMELDIHREDYLPPLLLQLWTARLAGFDVFERGGSSASPPRHTTTTSDTTRTIALSSMTDTDETRSQTSHSVDSHGMDSDVPSPATFTTTAPDVAKNASSLDPTDPTQQSVQHVHLNTHTLFSKIALPLERAMDVGVMAKMEEPEAPSVTPRRLRRFATHAPFAYCTAMHRYLATRYEREYTIAALQHRFRHRQDLLVPFVYNAFIMARPWAASPKYLQYLLDMHLAGTQDTGRDADAWAVPTADITTAVPAATTDSTTATAESSLSPLALPHPVHIYMDNDDGCAPATMYAGPILSKCIFAKFLDDMNHNKKTVSNIQAADPLFFNINAGFSSAKVATYLLEFLQKLFPNRSYIEDNHPATDAMHDDGVVLRPLYEQLMSLPLILVASYVNGACPLVRSLQLSLPDHRGPVYVVVHRSAAGQEVSEGDNVTQEETLSGARRRLRHRVYNGMPVLRCAFRDDAVRVVNVAAHVPLSAELTRLIDEAGAGASVELPATCRAGDDAVGVRRAVRGLVVDARARTMPLVDSIDVIHALRMPGQTLALEDFAALPHGDGESDAVVLTLSVADADARGVHWIYGASESDLLLSYPLPVAKYENMEAQAEWI